MPDLLILLLIAGLVLLGGPFTLFTLLWLWLNRGETKRGSPARKPETTPLTERHAPFRPDTISERASTRLRPTFTRKALTSRSLPSAPDPEERNQPLLPRADKESVPLLVLFLALFGMAHLSAYLGMINISLAGALLGTLAACALYALAGRVGVMLLCLPAAYSVMAHVLLYSFVNDERPLLSMMELFPLIVFVFTLGADRLALVNESALRPQAATLVYALSTAVALISGAAVMLMLYPELLNRYLWISFVLMLVLAALHHYQEEDRRLRAVFIWAAWALLGAGVYLHSSGVMRVFLLVVVVGTGWRLRHTCNGKIA